MTSVIDRLAPVVERDAVLAGHFRTGWMWQGDRLVKPSGVDELCFALARHVVTYPEQPVALALPRGSGPLPAGLGLYLALWRKVLGRHAGRMSGSVLVSTQRAALRSLCRHLEFDGSKLDSAIAPAKLVSVPALGRVKPAARNLSDRSISGLSQDDSYLLFAPPNIVPPLAYNVISAMVVDTAGCSEGSWEQTFERNQTARRRQVWLGELGDQRFVKFCEERSIVLLQLGWEVLGEAVRRWGVGSSTLASTALAQRALTPPTLGYCEVSHEEVEYYLREVFGALSEMRRYARGKEGPEEVMFAYMAVGVLSRLAYPLRYYEQAVERFPFSRAVKWLTDRINQVSPTPFRGRWKEAYRAYWPVVTAALARLTRLLDDPDESPKFWAMSESVMKAADNGGLTILCHSRAESAALRCALKEELGLGDGDSNITVRPFSKREQLDSPEYAETALLLAPPPERKADIYLSAENAGFEVLCYGHEVKALRARANRVSAEANATALNHSALDQLGIGAHPPEAGDEAHAAPEPVRVSSHDADSRFEAAEGNDESAYEPPDADAEFWKEAPGLLDAEIGALDPQRPQNGDRPGPSGMARLVTFVEGPQVFFAEEGEVTVVVSDPDAESEVMSRPPSELEPGMRVAVLPGAERGSLLAQLMATYDEQLEQVRERYEPMYKRALSAAIEKHDIDMVALLCNRSPEAVRTWISGCSRPGDAAALQILLLVSEDEQAIRNHAVIWRYFTMVRGAHRLIGRVLNEAVGEVATRGEESESLRRLNQLVGVDLTDLLENTHVLTVASVSEPQRVPTGVCGLFRDPDDQYLQQKGAL